MEQIKFQIETEKILNLLTSEIYDSPYALLRENVQNAYDAILMRKSIDKTFLPRIDISLNGDNISITDNGIGMSKDTIKNNFWKAGASGKNTPEARKAGVVGTFGIGAMANFGISSYLKVESHLYGDNKTIISDVKKENISVLEDCININIEEDDKDAGTKVTAALNKDVSLNITDATNYLKQYVQYLNIPIYLNGTIISQKEYFPTQNSKEYFQKTDVNAGGIRFNLQLFQNGTIVSMYLDNLFIGNNLVDGNVYLTQNQRVILGLRNYFGLAQMPINTILNFGGIVNLSILHPTAGREAISRESIQIVSQIITTSEKILVEEYSKYDICDSNPLFLQYIFKRGLYNLAGRIKIQSKPTE
jgi:molecular chaperone HtpG